jgi:hypothetical protein
MKSYLKTLSIIVFTTILVVGIYSFKTPVSESKQGGAVYIYRQFSTIESVVPGGLGRSRILTTDDDGQVREKELKNFYSLVGINFDNIANNDRVIVDRINDFSYDGWELVQVTSGTNQQSSNGSSSGGIFITRYLFRKLKS